MVPEIRKILYATDLSKNSAYAGLYVIGFARQYGAKIVMLHIIEPGVGSTWLSLSGSRKEQAEKDSYEKSVNIMKDRFDRYCKAIGEDQSRLDIISKMVVRVGQPVEEILNVAEEEKCDMFALGSHSKGFLKHTFLGSVSKMVLDRSRKPVMVVPLPEGELDWEGLVQSETM
jgi:nucleotide-binding universal stress UspA family protein